jgi:hypothetical protein
VGSKSKKQSLYSISRENVASEAEFTAYKKVMFGESHRSCALMASAYVEHMILGLIRTKLIILTEKEENTLFFEEGSTLGTFAARVDIAYGLGLITPEQKSDLNIIRRVRNVFAHAIKDIDFQHPLIQNECEKFKFRPPSAETRTKDLYIMACHSLGIDFGERVDPSNWVKASNLAKESQR